MNIDEWKFIQLWETLNSCNKLIYNNIKDIETRNNIMNEISWSLITLKDSINSHRDKLYYLSRISDKEPEIDARYISDRRFIIKHND